MTLSLWDAFDRWRALAGPLADFVAATPFLASWAPVPRRPRHPLAAATAAALLRRVRDGTGFILDASPGLCLAVSQRLLPLGASVAPAYFRWPHAEGIVPSAPLTAWLLSMAITAAGIEPAGHDNRVSMPCLLLDARRSVKASPRALRTRFDNRFIYGTYQLPPAARWLGLGVTRLVWAGPTASVATDLEEYAQALKAGGLNVELVALSSLARLASTGLDSTGASA